MYELFVKIIAQPTPMSTRHCLVADQCASSKCSARKVKQEFNVTNRVIWWPDSQYWEFFIFLVVSEPVSEKFGIRKKVLEQVLEKFGTEKKVLEPVSEKFGTGKVLQLI